MCFDTDDVFNDAVGDKLSLNSKFLQKTWQQKQFYNF